MSQRKGCRVKVDFQISDVCDLIEEMRSELIQLAMSRSLSDPEVVELSQTLDQLLNEYEFLNQNYQCELNQIGA